MRAALVWQPQLLAVLIIAAVGPTVTDAVQARARANPIRKVVNLLQNMERKVREEGDKKKALFDKFICFCKSTGDSLATSMASAEERIPQLDSSIKQSNAERDQISSDLVKTKSDMGEAQKAVQEATEIREKDRQAFEKESNEMKANINALGKAIEAIKKGQGLSFLQSKSAAVLRQLSLSMNMGSEDRDLMSAFLAGGGTGAQRNDPQSDEVLGILKQMKSDMSKDLSESVQEETQAQEDHESLMAAKKKEMTAGTKAVLDKTSRVGKLAVEITTMENSKEDTQESLVEDRAFLANLQKACSAKQAEWESYSKLQTHELVAIADTIKLLNDDDALDLFKKTLPGSQLEQTSFSFVQVQRAAGHKGSRMSKKRRKRKDPRLRLVELALKGQKGGLDQVVDMVDDLVQLLDEDQRGDDDKKELCVKEIDETEDEIKVDKRGISDKKTVLADTSDSLESVRQEIDSLVVSLKQLDIEVAEATEQRKKEHAQSVEAQTDAGFAKQVLELAKKKLAKFYTSAEVQQSTSSDDGDLDGAASFVQLDSEDTDEDDEDEDEQSAQMPQAPDLSYRKKSESAGGATEMIEMLRDTLQRQIQEIQNEEERAQQAYEEFLMNCKKKRALDAKAISDKEGIKAELEAYLHEDTVSTKGIQKQLQSTVEELGGLHKDCDWLLKNYEVRKQARAEERDALLKAKTVLENLT